MASSVVLNCGCCTGLMGTSAQGCGCSGLMGTSETCFWTRSGLGGLSKSSMIVKGSLRGPTELSGFGLVYTFQPGAVVLGMEDSVGQIVWSLKESTVGGGGLHHGGGGGGHAERG